MRVILKRLHLLIIKLISTNGVFFILASIGFFLRIMPWYGFVSCGAVILTYKGWKRIKEMTLNIK